MPNSRAPVQYRVARAADLVRTYEVMLEAEGDLARSRHLSAADLALRDRARALAARAAAMQDFPDRFWVAEAGGKVVGFGIGYLREDHWHLKSLQVVPAYQGLGVGS